MRIKNQSDKPQTVTVNGKKKTIGPYGELPVDKNDDIRINHAEHVEIVGDEQEN